MQGAEWLLSFFYSWVNPWHLLQFTLASDGTKWGLGQPGLARTQECSGHSPFSPAIVYLSGGAKAGCFLEPLCWLCTIQRCSWHRGNSLVAIATGFKALLYPRSGKEAIIGPLVLVPSIDPHFPGVGRSIKASY